MFPFTHASTAVGVSAGRKKRGFSLERQEAVTGVIFVLPILLGFSVFALWAIIYSLGISLTKWDLLTAPKYVGFQNYIKIFKDNSFWQCIYNTVYFVAILVPVVLVLSMAAAIAINHKASKLTNFFKVSFYMPYITSTVAISMVWLWIFSPDNGLANIILHAFGVANPPSWLESTTWAKPALIIMRVWQMLGYYMILYLSGLQTISDTYYEAAEVDGATKWQKIRHITIPLLSNTTFFVIIMLIIESFNIFESIFVMTNGGPGGSTNTMMYYVYSTAFDTYKMGYASALSWVLFAIIFTLTLVQFKLKKNSDQ